MGLCASTERWDKQQWHRRWRRREKQSIGINSDFDNFITTHRFDVSNAYDFNKDGKLHLGCPLDESWDEKWMRK